METQNTETNWMTEELKTLKNTSFDEERKPALKLKENVTAVVEIDFSKPFDKWIDEEKKTIKKIIPVKYKGEELVWWLNVKNPIYNKLIELGAKGQTTFTILQTGTADKTKYILVTN